MNHDCDDDGGVMCDVILRLTSSLIKSGRAVKWPVLYG